MKIKSKLVIAGLAGVAGWLSAATAFAGPVGTANSAVSPLSAPIEKTSYYHPRRWCPPTFARSRWGGWRDYHQHYHYHYHAACCSQPHRRAAVYNPYFTTYTPAGVVSYPVYRVDRYAVDYNTPIVTYGTAYDANGW